MALFIFHRHGVLDEIYYPGDSGQFVGNLSSGRIDRAFGALRLCPGVAAPYPPRLQFTGKLEFPVT